MTTKLLNKIGLDVLGLLKTFGVTFVGTVALGWTGVVASVSSGHLSSAKDLIFALVLSGASTGAHAVLQVLQSKLNKTSTPPAASTPAPPTK